MHPIRQWLEATPQRLLGIGLVLGIFFLLLDPLNFFFMGTIDSLTNPILAYIASNTLHLKLILGGLAAAALLRGLMLTQAPPWRKVDKALALGACWMFLPALFMMPLVWGTVPEELGLPASLFFLEVLFLGVYGLVAAFLYWRPAWALAPLLLFIAGRWVTPLLFAPLLPPELAALQAQQEAFTDFKEHRGAALIPRLKTTEDAAGVLALFDALSAEDQAMLEGMIQPAPQLSNKEKADRLLGLFSLYRDPRSQQVCAWETHTKVAITARLAALKAKFQRLFPYVLVGYLCFRYYQHRRRAREPVSAEAA